MWKVLRYFILGYGLLCVAFHYYQHLLYFQPKVLPLNHALIFPVRVKFTEAKIPYDANTLIDVVKFEPSDSMPKGVVLFFHGNRYNVEHYSTYAPYFTKHGYEVWMPDYPGYGRSTGEINPEVLNALAIQLYKMARTQFEPNKIIIYGKSLGTGIASGLAAVRDCRHLILETPYYSLSSLTQSYVYFLPIPLLIKFNLETGKNLEKVTAPVTVIHGTKDELVPVSNMLRLTRKLKEQDALYLVAGAKHNTLPAFEDYFKAIDSVMVR